MSIVKEKNFVVGILYIICGVALAIGATSYRVGTADRMGPGYFPLGIGLALALTGVCLLVGVLMPIASHAPIGTWPLRRLATVLLSVVLFGLLIEPLGLVIAIPVLLGVSSLAHPDFAWRPLLYSIMLLVPLTWGIFILLLGLQFPLLPSFLMP